MAKSKIGIMNWQETPSLVVYVEPWGEDYTLLPDEKLEIIADSGDEDTPWFIIVKSDVEFGGAIEVYCEDTADYIVMQNNQQLKCGHRRGERL